MPESTRFESIGNESFYRIPDEKIKKLDMNYGFKVSIEHRRIRTDGDEDEFTKWETFYRVAVSIFDNFGRNRYVYASKESTKKSEIEIQKKYVESQLNKGKYCLEILPLISDLDHLKFSLQY